MEFKLQIHNGHVLGKQVNTATNAKMGKRHINYESMLKTLPVHQAEAKVYYDADFDTTGFISLCKLNKEVNAGMLVTADIENETLINLQLKK